MGIRDTQKFDTSIDGFFSENGDSTPIFRKLIGRELSHSSIANPYMRCRVDFTSNVVGTEAPYFMHLGIPAVNTLDELNPFGTPATRVRRPTDGFKFSVPGHVFGEVTAVGIMVRGQNKSIAIKPVLKLGGKIRILGVKIFL